MITFYSLGVLLTCIKVTFEYNDLFDYEDRSELTTTQKALYDDMQLEPIVPISKEQDKQIIAKNINCDYFPRYALNCTVEAALMYNSSRKAPPLPSTIENWCRAIRHLTNCAIDWNSDCRDVTESHFNEESIRGHMHVVSSVCDDEAFLNSYADLTKCIDGSADQWERCYTTFKTLVDEQKNSTHEWTHFDTHFYLCCSRAQFRRCTLDVLFAMPEFCTYEQAVTLQKFSVILSKGAVFQDCDRNMMYANCPGGDPRPATDPLADFINLGTFKTQKDKNGSDSDCFASLFCILCCIFMCGLVK